MDFSKRKKKITRTIEMVQATAKVVDMEKNTVSDVGVVFPYGITKEEFNDYVRALLGNVTVLTVEEVSRTEKTVSMPFMQFAEMASVINKEEEFEENED